MAQSGQLKALMNLTMPFEQTKGALFMLFLPYAARVAKKHGKSGTRVLGARLTLLSAGGAILYWSIIIPLHKPVFQLLYSGRYMEVVNLLPLLALGQIFWSAAYGPSVALRAMESPASVFVAVSYTHLMLLEAPTIEQLAATLRQDGWSQHWSSLVPIQPAGSHTPFFCIHGVGGNVVGFHELAQHMKPDYPFYGLQSQGLDGKHACHTRIEDMAAHYLDEICTVQPKGPYQMGGFSLGGLVAYEMACQLLARGEEVGLSLIHI